MGNLLATRLDGDFLVDAITAAGAIRAVNVVGLRDAVRLELLVDGRVGGVIELDPEHAERAGVECAAALIERQAAGHCSIWELRLWCPDGDADVLVAEWHCPS